jgi:PUA-domain protein
MKRTRLKSKDVNRDLAQYSLNLTKKDKVELVEDEHKFIVINGQASFFYYQDKVLPTLKYLQTHDLLKKVVVDMGAVKFVVNGADIMRPGITHVDEGIDKDDFIVIIDKNNKKPLAIGISALNTAELRASTSGKFIKNIHYVGDDIWRFEL